MTNISKLLLEYATQTFIDRWNDGYYDRQAESNRLIWVVRMIAENESVKKVIPHEIIT